MKIIAPIPCFGRIPLLRLTVKRLQDKNKIHKVILIGHELEVEALAEELNCEFVYHANEPLGSKWNAGFIAAKKYDPDGVLFVGSSDWISDNYIEYIEKELPEFDMLGMLGCYFTDIGKEIRSVYWKGYGKGNRSHEPIGIGRVLSARILNAIDWRPFDIDKNNSMDFQMYHKVIQKGGKVGIFDAKEDIQFVSISTAAWTNKHIFSHHWSNIIPSVRINSNQITDKFPELIDLKNQL